MPCFLRQDFVAKNAFWICSMLMYRIVARMIRIAIGVNLVANNGNDLYRSQNRIRVGLNCITIGMNCLIFFGIMGSYCHW